MSNSFLYFSECDFQSIKCHTNDIFCCGFITCISPKVRPDVFPHRFFNAMRKHSFRTIARQMSCDNSSSWGSNFSFHLLLWRISSIVAALQQTSCKWYNKRSQKACFILAKSLETLLQYAHLQLQPLVTFWFQFTRAGDINWSVFRNGITCF